MPIVARDDDAPTGPPEEERLAWERASRAMIRRVFEAVLADRWEVVLDLYREAQAEGEWFLVAVWAGLPNTVKSRLREMNDANRGTERSEGG